VALAYNGLDPNLPKEQALQNELLAKEATEA
jgi:hypothetical protein